MLAVAALVVIWPDPPSPAGVVEEYFERLGEGDTEAALALVTAASDGSPLLAPAVLADEADRPDDVKVTADEPYAGGSLSTTVTAAYTLGGQQVEQRLAVVETGDDENPYRIQQALVRLTVTLPYGLDISVNGVPVEPVAAARGLPVLPGRYRATTSGNLLFAGATRDATYTSGSRVAAEIDLTRLDLASSAQGAVQQAVQSYLDANCVNPSYGSRCPVEAPSMSWSQNTSWTFEAYPQVQVSPGDRQAQVAFTTTTPGSANYTITYSDFGGAEQTQTGTVPIDVSGNAGIGDDGAVAVALGY